MLCHLIGSADATWHNADIAIHQNDIWFCLRMNRNTNDIVSHSLCIHLPCVILTEWNSEFNTPFSPPFMTVHSCYAVSVERHNSTRIEMRWKMEFVIWMNGILHTRARTHTLAMQQSLAKTRQANNTQIALAHTVIIVTHTHVLRTRIYP